MPEPARTPLGVGPLLLWTLAVWLSGGLAHAHRLHIFATCEGKTIRGRAYFSGNRPAMNVKVEVFDPTGKKLGETTSNDNGEFAFQARLKCDHTIVVDTGDGHRATYRVKAAELPDSLPKPEPAGSASDAKPEERPKPPPTANERAKPDAVQAPTMSDSKLEAMVERVVSRHVRPLREQIDRYEAKRRLHDVLGGIGYILGLAGIAFFFLGSARKGARRPPSG